MTKPFSFATLAVCTALAVSFVGSATAQGLRSGGSGSSSFSLPSLSGMTAQANVTREADYIVALVNSEPITRNQLEQAVARVRQQAAGQQLPPAAQLYPQVLDQLINTRVELQSAKEMGVNISEPMVDQVALNIAQQNQIGDLAELRRRVEADGLTWNGFRSNLREQLTLSRVREQAQNSRTQISEREIDDYLLEHGQGGAQQAASASVNLGHILIELPENATADVVARQQAKAQSLADQARQPNADFAALAKANSNSSAERDQGGAMGLRPADRYPELFIQSTQSLPVGGIAGPIRSGAGFHILKVLERPSAGNGGGVQVTQTHARHILLRPDGQLSEAAAVERLGQMRRDIVSGKADFATLARQQSEDGSAEQGGDLGWANPGMFVPEFEQALNRLQPGQVSEPLVSRFGVHLIEVLERRQGTVSEREQRDSVRAILREQKSEESYAEWMREIRARAFVEYRNTPQ